MTLVDEIYCICPWHDYGEHIQLRCKNHPKLTWSTKNIGSIGERTIFFDLHCEINLPECKCPVSDLYHTCKDSEEYNILRNTPK